MDPNYNQTNQYQFLDNGSPIQPYDDPERKLLRKILVVLFIFVVAFAAWQIIPAIETAKHTGTLSITTTAGNSQISITQDNREALVIGTGDANVRLEPGTYQVAAFANGVTKTADVTISVRHNTTTHLNMSSNVASNSAQHVRTVEDVNFEGTNELFSQGLSSDQVSEMEQYFFQFDSSAQTVNIDTSSIEPGAHNPNVVSPFSLNFNVAVDGTTYKATIAYYDTNNITLTLYNSQTSVQIYTAGTIQAPTL